MPDYRFNKSDKSQLYFYSDTGTPVPGATYTVAFLQDPAGTDFPAYYTIAQSWNDRRGTYLFYNGSPPDEPAFVNKVRGYLSSGNLKDTRFLWIEDCIPLITQWVTASMAVNGENGEESVAQFTRINFGNYSLCINMGQAVCANDPNAGAPSAGFVITRSATAGFSLDTGSGASPLSGFGGTISIPLKGSGIGALEFSLTVAKSQSSAPDTELGSLNAGMKFFYIDDTYKEGYLADLHYPLIDPSAEPIDFYPSLDPINQLVAQRTYFSFLPPGGAAAKQFPSYYRTWVGREVNLTPKAGGDPKLVFSPRPQFLGDDSPPYYLSPCGSFTISIPPLSGEAAAPSATESESATRIMCGVSPVEYVGYIKPASGAVSNLLTFHPGKNAFSPSFSASGQTSGDESGLKGDAVTSYVTFTPNGPDAINYYSQPNESVFYDPSSFAPPSDPNFLDLKEIITKQLSNAETDAIPMVPLAGLAGYPNPLLNAQFEIMAVNQARRGIVQAAAANAARVAASEVTSLATTRHGMLGFFGTQTAGTLPFVKVELAQSDSGTNTLTMAGPNGGDITGILKSALQSNQLFLVISNKTNFETYGSFLSSLLTIAGIPFDLSPSKWSENGTIIVYKYAGQSIDEMAADLGSWSYPAQFTDGGMTQTALLDIIEGIKENERDPSFQQIYDAVTNPNWNGILAFNAEVNLASLPGQLAGIAAGIDPAQFKAHHLGMNLSPVVVTNGLLTMQDTALFGLINYVDTTPFQDVTSDYDFKVSLLRILFGNSQIKDFACKIDLMVNSLFGSGVVLENDAAPSYPQELYSQNIVELNGYYQGAASDNSFSFSTNRDLKFKASSMVLDEVEIQNAGYVTENPDAAPDPSGIKHIRTHFSFTGLIRFYEVKDFDSFSFGNSAGDLPFSGGLAFSDLTIRMSYDLDSEGRSSNRTFELDANNLTVDAAASKARPQSLYSHFPLKFKNFIQGKSGTTPVGLGYLGVATPANESGLMYPWFGLQYELNLGTLGALAGSVGFTATLLVAWSPGTGYSIFTGIKIPGASPESLSFSIEGLLGLSIDNIRFLSERTPQGNSSYTLVFNNLALRFFGMKIPQSAYVDMVLFGNPDPSKKASSLGWYAAYLNGSNPQ